VGIEKVKNKTILIITQYKRTEFYKSPIKPSIMNKNIIVLSHRRSGTHLTIDLIKNNFKKYSYHNYITINETSLKEKYSERKTNKYPYIFKSHLANPIVMNDEKLLALFKESKIILVSRNKKDTLVSLYEFNKKNDPVNDIPFSEFLRYKEYYKEFNKTMNKIEYIKEFYSSWNLNKNEFDLLDINYEDIIRDYKKVISDIAYFIDEKPNKKSKDIRIHSKIMSYYLRAKKKLFKTLGLKTNFTAVTYRKGKIGDSRNYFSPDDIRFYNQIMEKQ
jgi:hypothetical protein